ncbi:hypothetical protein COU78_01155 [Candidatus Peregrinibacteria bacterium CG10_big_fil_rev_8_21_14_0_10_49_24]|nr:MAG: hypothetical protein COV83_04120 [Candidatus Peregrinibacteria bacterium CG11_big_fil_rev_8_21_14_0_20_49_14]PIR51334.1 MAG: hypothetical protein COU78_01155 [Candidatus Peregrinibacteria bacterium CG10_big_fil_rev_8_21_14_0_10_49_24]PJA68098.1 MAG: hypothetical protein CO157_00970 [Candidatus Peregrinibacteria bacterium CG_4_9_14_3_um_filter_49_12]
MSTFSVVQWAKGLALFSGVFFIICFFWSFALRDPVLYELHMNVLRMTFPGFSGINATSFVVGIIESIFLGLVVGWVISSSLNMFSTE